MKRWWADTLFKRVFLLMWFGLVASHLIAFGITTRVHGPSPGPGGPPRGGLPVLPSLPPGGLTGGEPPAHERLHTPPPHEPPGDGPGDPPHPHPGGLPAEALWLDYGIRFLAIGAVAWFGARWLTAPMRRLSEASETLGLALGQKRHSPLLDAAHGPLEVRQTAQAFNTMAQRLRAQFDAQTLLMAAISHDLRTPLTRLRLRLEALDPRPEAERCVQDVRELDALIGSVLGMMREQHAGEAPQQVDVGALVQSRVDDLVEQGARASLLHGDSAPTRPSLARVQPAALSRMLGNLIDNALHHGGSVRVGVDRCGDDICVVVDDDGPGIPAAQLDAAFEPFRRLDPPRDFDGSAGSGLGLYIARDLAQRNGGRLTLANRAEGGLRAELVLPAA